MRTSAISNDHAIRPRGWRGPASIVGFVAAVLLLAACGGSDDLSVEPASEPAPAVERVASPIENVDCGPVPAALSDAVDAEGAACTYGAPAALIAQVAGELTLEVDGCDVEDGSVELLAGHTVNLSDAAEDTCRFQFSWTPAPAAAPTTTVVEATTTTSTTTSTTTTTTTTTTTAPPPPPTTQAPAPPPTTTSAVGS
ncbi:MAG: hypothetical protein AAF081_13615 [Actinomycetota bacterium]